MDDQSVDKKNEGAPPGRWIDPEELAQWQEWREDAEYDAERRAMRDVEHDTRTPEEIEAHIAAVAAGIVFLARADRVLEREVAAGVKRTPKRRTFGKLHRTERGAKRALSLTAHHGWVDCEIETVALCGETLYKVTGIPIFKDLDAMNGVAPGNAPRTPDSRGRVLGRYRWSK